MMSSNQFLALTLILEDIAAMEAILDTVVMEDTAAMPQATVATETMEATAATEAMEATADTAAMLQAIVVMVELIPVQVAQELALQKLLLVQQECL